MLRVAMQNKNFMKLLLLMFVTMHLASALQSTNSSESNQLQQNTYRDRRFIKRKPGFFRTLFSVIYEQWRDTKNTFGNVNKMINDNFAPENPPITPPTTVSSDPNATTTKAPFRLTRSEFNKILRRNLKGIQRLYNIELQDALKVSERNYAEFRKNASLEVSKFL